MHSVVLKVHWITEFFFLSPKFMGENLTLHVGKSKIPSNLKSIHFKFPLTTSFLLLFVAFVIFLFVLSLWIL